MAKTCFAVPGSRHSGVVANRGWTRGNKLPQESLKQSALIAGAPSSSRQSVGFNGCVRQKTWRMRRHHELCSLSCIDRSQRSKSQNERKEERSYYNQSKGRTDCRGYSHQGARRRCMSKMRPRTLCFQHNFGTNSALSWMDSRRSTMYVNQSMPKWSHNSWRAAEYQPYRRWKLSEWFWWLRNTSKTRRWRPKSTSFNDWTAQVQALAANPAWAQEQFAQWQLLHQQYQHLQYQQQFGATSTTDPWQVLPEEDGSTGDRWSMDTGTDRIGV